MKSRTLLTMFGAGLLASTAFSALAGGELEKQLRMTDGNTEPAAVATASAGAAGRPGAATHKGNAAPTVVPALRIGAAGRPGKATDDAWLQKQLRMSDGNN